MAETLTAQLERTLGSAQQGTWCPMAPIEYLIIERELRDRVVRRGRAATVQESAVLEAEIGSLLQRRNDLTGRHAA